MRGERACERARRKEEIPGAEDDMPLSPPPRVRRSIRQSPTPLARPPPAPGHFPETDAHERSPRQERFQCAAAARLPVRGGPGAPHRRRCCYVHTPHVRGGGGVRSDRFGVRFLRESVRVFVLGFLVPKSKGVSARDRGREEERIPPPPPRVFTGLASTHIGRGTPKTGKTYDGKQNAVCDQRKSRNEKTRAETKKTGKRDMSLRSDFHFYGVIRYFKRLEFKNYIRIYL